MSYLQQFGVSRISPLNLTEREKPSKEEVLNMMTAGVDQDPDIDPATKIIEKKLSVQNIISSDIFYQTFDTKGGGGKMLSLIHI